MHKVKQPYRILSILASICLFSMAMGGPLAMGGPSEVAEPVITEVLVIVNGTGQAEQLRIEGENFGPTPLINIGNYADSLTVADSDCTSNPPLSPLAPECVIADLPSLSPTGIT